MAQPALKGKRTGKRMGLTRTNKKKVSPRQAKRRRQKPKGRYRENEGKRRAN